MSQNFEASVKITADGKGLATEARAAKNELSQLGETAKRANTEAAAAAERFTEKLKRQADTLGMTASQVRAYDAAQLKLNEAQRASVEASNRQITAYEQQQAAARSNIDVMAKVQSNLVGLAAGYLSVNAAMAGGKALIETALANERLNNTLIVATGSVEAAARETAFLGDASEKLGLQFATTSSQYAKLAAAAKGTALEGQATRDIFLAVSKAATVLGMSAADAGGSLLAIQQMISKGKVSAEELRGQFGERVPGAFQMAARAIGVTTAELDKMLEQGQLTAERLLPALAQELENTFGAQAQTAAQGLQAKINRLENSFTDLKTAIGNTGLIDLLSDGIVLATRFVDALSGAKVVSAVDAQKQKIIEMREELESLGNRKHIPLIGNLLFDKKQADLLSQRIDDGIQDLKKLEQAAQEAADAMSGKKVVTPGAKPELPKEWKDAAEKAAKEREKAAAAAEREMQRMVDGSTRVIAALKLETEQIGLNAIQKKMLVAATEAAKAPTQELAQEIMASAQAWALATQQQEELMAAEKERLEGIKAIEKAEQEAAKASEEAARQAAQEWNQLWGNVEQTAKTAFVQFTAHGKSAMQSIGESIKLAIIDVLYQLTVRKWIINIGASLSGFVGAGTANAAGAGDIISSGSNLLSNGLNIGSLIGRGASSLGFSSFGAGISGASSAGVFGPGGLSYLGGAGTAIGGNALGAGGIASAGAAEFGAMGTMGAGLSSGLAAAAGPLAIAFAATQGLKMLAGNKRLGGGFGNAINAIGDIPIIGDMLPIIPLLNGLFGRGPLKQKETQLTGDIGAEGLLSGYLTTNFKAKGGLLVGSKRDFAGVNLLTGAAETDNGKLQGVADGMVKYAMQLAQQINQSIGAVNTSLRGLSDTLGLSTKPLDDFRHQINLVSESGKALTDEQIAAEIAAISDEMVKSLLPTVDQFAKSGETSIQTISRLGAEFNALVSGAELLLGKSSADAKALVSGGTYQGRTAFVDAAGGLDAFQQKITFFADNFLTDAQRLAPVQAQVNDELKRLGLSSDLTRDQFRNLVQSFGQVNGISEETLQALLNLAPAFVQVRDQSKNIAGEAFSGLQKAVEAEKTKITQQYNDALKTVNGRIEDVTQSIGKLRTLSEALKATVSQIRPMSRDAAKQQIQDAIAAARAGGALPEADSLREALGTLGKGAPGFTGSFEYAREQAKTALLVESLGKMTDDQLTLDERGLAALEAQRDRLTAGFEAETARLDNLLTQGQEQIDALNGINSSVLSLSEALARFNVSSISAGGGVIGGGSAGNPAISAQQIRDFVAQPGRTEMEIYNAARDNNVSFEQYAAATGADIANLNAWAEKNNVPKFAKGGFHRGGLRIVGDKGPELESTGPSNITSNNDLTKLLSNEDVVEQLGLLLKELQKNSEINNRVANRIEAATQGGTVLRVKQIA